MLTEEHIQLLEARGLDVEILSNLGWSSKSSENGGDWIEIPYTKGGKVVGRKYRTIAGEKRFYQEKGSEQCLYGLDALEGIGDEVPIWICEGEMDAIIAIQCGYYALSVPNGAPDKPVEQEHATKFDYLKDLPPKNPIILATDSDMPGKILRDELAMRIGKARCKWVSYPLGKTKGGDPIKDLNDTYLVFGKRGVDEVFKRAQWMKLDGVYDITEIPNPPDVPAKPCMIDGLDENLKFRAGEMTLITGIPSHGKALSIETDVPTVDGWKTMGSLAVGDTLFDESGNLCKILYATPVMFNHQCFEIEFLDGVKIIADAEHLWLTNSEKARRSARQTKLKRGTREYTKPKGKDQRHLKTFPSVVTTLEISKTLKSQGKFNHQVALTKPIKYSKKKLSLAPYVLGAWLGDGHSDSGSFTCHDHEVINAIMKKGYSLSERRTAKHTYTILGISPHLAKLNLLKNKHIPTNYLRSSIKDRIELLRGLMDTDGHCAKDRVCEFVTMKERLAEDVYELVSGLGIKARIITGRAMLYEKDCGKKYRVTFSTTLRVFNIKRKAIRQRCNKKLKRTGRTIVACRPVDSVPVRCIQVDSPSKLFLVTKSFIPTHNTTVAFEIVASHAICYQERIAIASFEMDAKPEWLERLRSYFLQKPVRLLPDNDPEIVRADEWIKDKFKFILANDESEEVTDLTWLLNNFSDAIIRYGCKIVLLDPWNAMEHGRPKGMARDEYIEFALMKIKRFAKRYQVHFLIVAHPRKMEKKPDGSYEVPTIYDVNGAAAWNDKVDLGVIIYREQWKATTVIIEKVRFFGKIGYPGKVHLKLDEFKHRFVKMQPEEVSEAKLQHDFETGKLDDKPKRRKKNSVASRGKDN